MIFNNEKEVRDYLMTTYPKSKGKTLAGWITSKVTIAVGVYEDEDLIQGIMLYNDPNRNKWILLDSLFADLATRNYIEYREELDEAIALFESMEEVGYEDFKNEKDEDLFFGDLD
jgi:hypothetical protein